MTTQPNFTRALFLVDQAAQILVLGDALASANGPAITAAFADVARRRGLAAMAQDAEIPIEQLEQALVNPDKPDVEVLRRVFEALIDICRHSDVTPGGDAGD